MLAFLGGVAVGVVAGLALAVMILLGWFNYRDPEPDGGDIDAE